MKRSKESEDRKSAHKAPPLLSELQAQNGKVFHGEALRFTEVVAHLSTSSSDRKIHFRAPPCSLSHCGTATSATTRKLSGDIVLLDRSHAEAFH